MQLKCSACAASKIKLLANIRLLVFALQGGKEINGAGALLAPPLLGAPAGTLVGPATPLNARGVWVSCLHHTHLPVNLQA